MNMTTNANTMPSSPAALTTTVVSATSALLSWTASADAQTPQAGLSYNMYIGTSSAGIDVQSPMASVTTGYRRLVAMGSQQGNTAFITGLTPHTNYYWGVQAIDGAYAGSAFATTGTLRVSAIPQVSTGQTVMSMTEDTPHMLTVSITDDNSFAQLTVTATSSNQSLIADGSMTQQGATGATTSFLLMPATHANGMVQITVSLTDTEGSVVSTTFTLTIQPVNDGPLVSTSQSTVMIVEDVSTMLTVSVTDIDTDYTSLTVTATSSNQSVIANAGILQSGVTGASMVFALMPVTNASGTTQVHVTVSDGEHSATTTFTVSVQPVNDAPLVSTTHTGVVTLEDVPTTLTVSLVDVDNAHSTLTLTATSGNQSLIPNANIVQVGSTSAVTSFTLTPVAEAFGITQVTLTVSDGQYSATTVFTVTVLSTNSPPTISTTQTAIMTSEDISTTLTVVVEDIDNAPGELVVTATSGNQSLIPNGNIVQTGSTSASTSFSIQPATHANGTTQVIVTVSDGEYSTTTTFMVTVQPVNDAPVISTTQTIIAFGEDMATTLTVAVSDIDHAHSMLTLTVTSGNQGLIPNANIMRTGATSASTSFVLEPVTNANGTTQVSVTVSDGQYSAMTIFMVTVLPVNDAPMISTTQTAIVMSEDIATTLTVSVADTDHMHDTLTVTATSGNQSLIPNANLMRTGATSATTALLLMPATNAHGTTQVTVTVSDGEYSETTVFTVTVQPVNDAPVVSTTQTVVMTNEDTMTTLTVSVSDIDHTFGNLTITATSGNQGLIPDAALVRTGATSASTSFMLMPATNAHGTTQVTVTVSDGEYSATTVFTVTVQPVNDAPVIGTTQIVVMTSEDMATTLTVSVSDLDHAYSTLMVTATSGNQSLIPVANMIRMGATGATTTFLLMPATNAHSTTQVTVTVSDGQYSATTVFTVTILPVNDAPSISTTQTIVLTNEDTATTLTVAVSDPDHAHSALMITATSGNQSLIPNGAIMRTGATSASTSFVLMPVSNGTTQVTVTISDGEYSATTVFTVTVQPVNDAPEISTAQTVILISEDMSTTLTVSVSDIDHTHSALTVTATSGNQALIPDASLVRTGATSASTSFVLMPADNANGTTQVTVTVSDGQYSATTVFTVTVQPVNDAPVISTAQTAIVMNEDIATTLSVTVVDVDHIHSALTITATSGNQSLIPDASIVRTGATGATTSFLLMPSASASGTTQVTIMVSDGQYSATTVFTVTIQPANDAPVIQTTQTVVTISEDMVTTLTVAISDPDHTHSMLTLTATSGNQSLIPNVHIVRMGATSASTSFVLTPAADAYGTTQVTVMVSDGQYSATTVFTVMIMPVNDAPVISTVQTVVMTNEDISTMLSIALQDIDHAHSALTVTAVSGNQSLIPDANIVRAGATGATTTFLLTPAADAYGTTQVTVMVSDGEYSATTTFTVIVQPVNDAPVISTVQTVVMTSEDMATMLTVTISDIDHAHSMLTLTATSGNQSLISNANIVHTGATSATTAFMVMPAANAHGMTHVTITVSDGQYSATTIFTITVQPVNDTPSISTTHRVIVTSEDTATTLTVAISDLDTGFSELSVTATSGSQSLIPNVHIVPMGATSASTSFLVIPATNAHGTTQVTITVSDEQYSATTVFTITVQPVNDAPALVSNTILTLSEGSTATITNSLLVSSDVDNAATQLTYSMTSPVTNGTVLKNGTTLGSATFTQADINAGVMTYQHNGGETTSDRFSFTVSDGAGGSIGTTLFNITVMPVNDAPVISTAQTLVMTHEDVSTTLTVAITDVDNTFGRLTVTATSGNQSLIPNAHIVRAGATGATTSFLLTPAANAHGTTEVTITVSDGHYSATTVFTVTVLPVNDAPVPAANAGLTLSEGSTATITSNLLMSSDVDNTAAQITYSITSPATNGTVLKNGNALGNGTFTQADIHAGMIAYEHNGSETTGDRFSFMVSDGAGGSIGTTVFHITVVPVNDAPVALHDHDSLCSGTGKSMEVVGNDMDRENNTLTVISVTQGSKGTVSIEPGNVSVLYHASVGVSGEDSFSYTISDGQGGISTATVTIFIPIAVTADAGNDQSICAGGSVQLSGGSTSPVGAISFHWSPAVGLDNPAIANPVATVSETTVYTLTVTDGFGCSASDQVTVTVLPGMSISATGGTMCLGGSVQLQASGGVSYHWSPSTGLDNVNIANPIAGPTETTVYTVTITGATGCVATRTVTVTVGTIATADAGSDITVCADGSAQLQAAGGVSYSWSPVTGLSNPHIANPVVHPQQTTVYVVTVMNAAGCIDSDTVIVSVQPLELSVRILLEGAYNASADSMATVLADQGLVPLNSPYASAGSVVVLPPGAVDWVEVELRSNPTTPVLSRSGFLLKDGRVVDTDGEAMQFSSTELIPGSYYIIIRHRNHLRVMSASVVSVDDNCTLEYDFTTAAGQAYEQFGTAMKSLGSRYGMIGGDTNQDGIVNAVDRVGVRNTSGSPAGYYATDLSLDGLVNAVDRVMVNNNNFAASQVP